MQKFIRSSVVLLAVLLSADATAQAATNIVCTGCVNTGDLAANSVSSAKIASGAVTSAKIQDATVALADLSADVRARLNRGMPVYAGGTMTGHLLGIEGRSGNGAAVEQVASVISSKGYLFEIRLDEGTLWDMGGVYFSGSGCTGEAYYSFDAAGAGELDFGLEVAACKRVIGKDLNLYRAVGAPRDAVGEVVGHDRGVSVGPIVDRHA